MGCSRKRDFTRLTNILLTRFFRPNQRSERCLAINPVLYVKFKWIQKSKEALDTMDYHTCDAMKRLNALRHQTNKKIENLNQLKRKYCETYDAKIQLDNILNIGGLGKVLRDLDNRLDKAKLKCEEADHIYRAYKQIKEKLEEVWILRRFWCI